MTELTSYSPGKIEIAKMPWTEDSFNVSPEQIKQACVDNEMERPGIQENRGDELPGISIVHSPVAQREIFGRKPGLITLE
jgi:hypothetical protein